MHSSRLSVYTYIAHTAEVREVVCCELLTAPAPFRALSAAEMEELIAAKPEARVAPMDPTGTILLEAENGIEGR